MRIQFMFDYGADECLWDINEGLLNMESFPISKALIEQLII